MRGRSWIASDRHPACVGTCSTAPTTPRDSRSPLDRSVGRWKRWLAIKTQIDLAQQTIRIAEDVVVWPVQERGETAYRLEIPSLHRFFRIGYEEYVLISLLDGRTTIPQACGLAAAQGSGSRAPGSRQAEAIQRWLLKHELAYLPENGPPRRQT